MAKKIRLAEVASARSGDKGDTCNVALFAKTPEAYEHLRREVTAERVKAHLAEIVRGGVERYEAPRVLALNFVLRGALGGGATRSLAPDPLGKTMGAALLRMEIPAPEP